VIIGEEYSLIEMDIADEKRGGWILSSSLSL